MNSMPRAVLSYDLYKASLSDFVLNSLNRLLGDELSERWRKFSEHSHSPQPLEKAECHILLEFLKRQMRSERYPSRTVIGGHEFDPSLKWKALYVAKLRNKYAHARNGVEGLEQLADMVLVQRFAQLLVGGQAYKETALAADLKDLIPQYIDRVAEGSGGSTAASSPLDELDERVYDIVSQAVQGAMGDLVESASARGENSGEESAEVHAGVAESAIQGLQSEVARLIESTTTIANAMRESKRSLMGELEVLKQDFGEMSGRLEEFLASVQVETVESDAADEALADAFRQKTHTAPDRVTGDGLLDDFYEEDDHDPFEDDEYFTAEEEYLSPEQVRDELIALRWRIWEELGAGPSREGLLRKQLLDQFVRDRITNEAEFRRLVPSHVRGQIDPAQLAYLPEVFEIVEKLEP